jgi:adenosylhomocysteine nucleosidase
MRMLSGLIGSGDAVIADAQAEILTYLASFNDKVLAVDMEAGGLSLARYERSVITGRPCGWVVIRGISDTADPQEERQLSPHRLMHAAVTLRHLLPAQAPHRSYRPPHF